MAPNEAEKSLEECSDEELVHRLALGDESALVVLYDRFGRALFSLALRITSQRAVAEEVVQEAFVRVWRHAGRFETSRGKVSSWMMGITHNLAIDELRKARSRPQIADTEIDLSERLVLTGKVGNVEQEAWNRIQIGAIVEALGEIPKAQRKVIEMAYFGGMTQLEISAMLGEPLGTVKTRIRLGMIKLRSALQEAVEIER